MSATHTRTYTFTHTHIPTRKHTHTHNQTHSHTHTQTVTHTNTRTHFAIFNCLVNVMKFAFVSGIFKVALMRIVHPVTMWAETTAKNVATSEILEKNVHTKRNYVLSSDLWLKIT